MKYIDAEKLKYEIERRKLSNYYTDTDDYEAELFEIIGSLQQEQPEEPVSDDLEEAANKFAVFYDQGTCDGIAQDCFLAGADWQKEQMMKEAVEVVVWDAGVDFAPHPVISVEDFNVKDGDKVRIIIVKEDEK